MVEMRRNTKEHSSESAWPHLYANHQTESKTFNTNNVTVIKASNFLFLTPFSWTLSKLSCKLLKVLKAFPRKRLPILIQILPVLSKRALGENLGRKADCTSDPYSLLQPCHLFRTFWLCFPIPSALPGPQAYTIPWFKCWARLRFKQNLFSLFSLGHVKLLFWKRLYLKIKRNNQKEKI